jgi:hypothetical protein
MSSSITQKTTSSLFNPTHLALIIPFISATRNSNTPATGGNQQTPKTNGSPDAVKSPTEEEEGAARNSGDSAQITMPNVRKFRPFTMNVVS